MMTRSVASGRSTNTSPIVLLSRNAEPSSRQSGAPKLPTGRIFTSPSARRRMVWTVPVVTNQRRLGESGFRSAKSSGSSA